MAKKKLKLSEAVQTNGEDSSAKEYRTLDQVWGDSGLSKYKTLDPEVYAQSLANMPDVDLTNHALSLGLVPNPDRAQLKKRLMTEFNRYAAQYSAPTKQPKQLTEKDVSEKVRRILAEGR